MINQQWKKFTIWDTLFVITAGFLTICSGIAIVILEIETLPVGIMTCGLGVGLIVAGMWIHRFTRREV